MVEGTVLAAVGLPRISLATISNCTLSAPPVLTNIASILNNPTVIPSTGLSEEVVQATVKVSGPTWLDCALLIAAVSCNPHSMLVQLPIFHLVISKLGAH